METKIKVRDVSGYSTSQAYVELSEKDFVGVYKYRNKPKCDQKKIFYVYKSDGEYHTVNPFGWVMYAMVDMEKKEIISWIEESVLKRCLEPLK